MKKFLIKINFYLTLIGFDPVKFFRVFKGVGFFLKDRKELKKQMQGNKEFKFGKLYPVLFDKFDESGVMKGHYFHTDLLIAQKIYNHNPAKHIDIGSRIDGFVAHVASFRTIEIFDIRPVISSIKNIHFKQADLMKLPDNMLDYCDSISSLHALEHFGLGRYGDEIDINGHLKAISNIHLMLKPGGRFYFAVPIGPQRIEFNAHRVFSVQYLIDQLSDKFKIAGFSYVDDIGDLHQDILLQKADIDANYNCNYGCGIFDLIKLDVN